jgi:hypothetical protein
LVSVFDITPQMKYSLTTPKYLQPSFGFETILPLSPKVLSSHLVDLCFRQNTH